MMTFVQLAVERVVNSLPEGLLIALGAWLLLRLMGRQNSGTRFAVWLVALTGVVALPFVSGLQSAQHNLAGFLPHTHPEIALSAFWASAFFFLWIAIAALALARVVAGVWQVRQIRRGCNEIPAANIDPALQTLFAETKRPVRLLTCETARVPAALGFRSPAIVLPAWALRDLTTDELRPILIHELAHLRRRDDWTNLVQKAIRAVLFFHPAVWWIDARLSIEREMACDDAVLAATGNPRAYAGCLIDLLAKGCERRGWTMAQAAVARARDASVRIARILRVGSGATTRIGRAALGVTASLALACAGIALCSPQLVAFVPVESASATQTNRALMDSDPGPWPAEVVPASFHPPSFHSSEKPVTHRRVAVKHHRVSRPAPEQQIASFEPTAPKHAVAMARAAAFESDDQAPMLIVFETMDSNAVQSSGSAHLQTVNRQSAAGIRGLQSTEDPAIQIQMLQVIDPETGAPVQILRIVLVVPQAGSAAQAI